jgi:predicted transcriptional regulator
MSEDKTRLLTDAELELMQVLWGLGEGTVRDVLEALPGEKQPAYTTVSTILRILEQKGFVASRKAGRSHIYTPAVEKPGYQARTLRRVVSDLFGGSPSALVRRLIAAEEVDEDELRALQRLLDERLGAGDEEEG